MKEFSRITTGKGAGRKIQVVIADDHPIFRRGLSDFVSRSPDLVVAGEASDGEEAYRLITRLEPEVAVLDINMPGMDGLEVSREIIRRKLPTEVVILTMHEDAEHFEAAMDAGIMGYVLKDSAAAEIASCIRSVLSGKSYISPSLSHHLIKRSVSAYGGIERKLGIDSLTPSERKVLARISEGKSTKEIASELFVSEKTVSAHRSNICSKLSLHGTNALLRFAIRHKDSL